MLKRRTLIHHGVMASTATLMLSPMTNMNNAVGRIGLGDPTISQSRARYQNQPNAGHACAACCMFVPGQPAHCTMIEGIIAPHGWCIYWQAGPVDTCS